MTVLLFPGQGSQKTGMGNDLFDSYPNLLAMANAILGYDLKQLCLQNPNDDLNKTVFTQPALFVVNHISYLHFLKSNDAPNYLLGHSLGEFNALCAAGVFDFETGLKIVKKRAELMYSVSETSMAAVIGASQEEIQEMLADNFPTIDVANINTPTQIVISGLTKDLEKAADFFEEEMLTFIPLKVSGAFHSRYMTPLKNEFEEAVSSFNYHAPSIPVVANFTAKLYPNNSKQIIENMVNQLDGSIQWLQSIEWLLEQGDCEFVEMGGSEILKNMIRKIKPVASGAY